MNKKIILFFFLIITSIYFWPFLKKPAFNLIDDGVSLRISKEVLSGNLSSLIETQNGRIRPFYWLYFVFIYIFSSTNPLGFWIGQAIVFALTLFSIWYLLADEKNLNKWKAYLIGLVLPILFFIPTISENLFRLGTAEVRQMLLLIWFMIWMKKSVQKKTANWVGFLIFFLAIFTKETSILLIPMVFAFLTPHIIQNFKKHKKRLCSLLFFSFFSLIFYSLVSSMKEASSYSANFNIDFAQMKINLLISRLNMNEIYYLLFALLSLSFVRFLLFLVKKKVLSNKKENYIFKILIEFWKENSFVIAALIGMLSSLFFIFSWEHQLERYYYPAYIFLFIYAALEMSKSAKLFLGLKENKYKILMLAFPILVLLTSYATFFQKTLPNPQAYLSVNSQIKNRWHFGYQNSYNIIESLLAEDIDKMYTLINDYEVVYELGLFANKLDYNKNKVEIFSPNKKVVVKNEYLFYLENIESAFLEDSDQNIILITVNSKDINLDNELYSRELLINQYSNRNNWVIWRKK